MDGMNNDIMQAIMQALDNVNKDEEGKKGKKMSVTVMEAKPEMGEMPEEGMDPDHMPEHDALMGHADDMEPDDYLSKLKQMHADGPPPELPQDDWSEGDMQDQSPTMMMQLAALKKKKPKEEDDGNHEYR